MNKKYKAFSLFEILLVLVIIGVIAAMTVAAFRPEAINEKALVTQTHSFFTASENAYQQIIFHHTANRKVTGLSSSSLLDYFIKYLDGEKFGASEDGTTNPCTSAVATGDAATYFNKAQCATFPTNITAGFYVNTACNETVKTKEYYKKDDKTLKSVTNTCGYIIYEIKGSTGVLGTDVFTIPLGKVAVKI